MLSSGIIYLAPGGSDAGSIYQNGSYASPFLSLTIALEAVKPLTQDITVLLFPGNHSVVGYIITGSSGFSVDNFVYGNPRGDMVNRRALTFSSVEGVADNTVIECAADSSSFLTVYGDQLGETTTLTVTVDSLTFKGCTSVLDFSGEKATVKDSVFIEMGSSMSIYYTYEVEVADSYFLGQFFFFLSAHIFRKTFKTFFSSFFLFFFFFSFQDNQGDLDMENNLEAIIHGCTFENTKNPGEGSRIQIFLYGDSNEVCTIADCTFQGSRLINIEAIGMSQLNIQDSHVIGRFFPLSFSLFILE